MTLTHKQKHALAGELIRQAGMILEFWQDGLPFHSPVLRDVDPEEAAAQLARWLQHLPGDACDARLPDPSTLKKKS